MEEGHGRGSYEWRLHLRATLAIKEGLPPVAATQLRTVFKGPIMAAGGFEPDSAEAIVEKGDADLVAFGRYFMANSMSATYHFRPFTRVDVPMAGRWLRTAEVVRWWGDPTEQIALLTEDLNEPLMRQWIVEHRRRPFAYLQAYPVNAWPQTHLSHLPEGTEVIDVFIGEPAMLGDGHGSRFLRAMAEKLLVEGATVVAVDPACDNHRARRAYARAGFVGEEIFETEEGQAVVMLFVSKASGQIGRPPRVDDDSDPD